VLGGDHSQSLGPIRAVHSRFPRLTVVHFDAHDDLRNEWMGTGFSHACVMRRVGELPGIKTVHLAIRSQDRDTAQFAREHGEKLFLARKRSEWRLDEILSAIPTDDVYITFDVDALDPSIMPSTGTPEPGGLSWEEATQWLRHIASAKRIVGFDVMELSPIAGLHAPDFLAAKLVYKIAGYSALREPLRAGQR